MIYLCDSGKIINFDHMIQRYLVVEGLQTEPALQIQFDSSNLTSFVSNLLILLV